MIRPLRILHRWLIPAVALGSLPLVWLALAQRTGPPAVESLPRPLRSAQVASGPRGPGGELVLGASVLSWVDEGSSLLLSTEESLGPDPQAYLSSTAAGGGLPPEAIWLGAVQAPGTTRLVKPYPPETAGPQEDGSERFLVVYSPAHESVLGSVRLGAAGPGGSQ